MRRILIVCLLLLLPWQGSWAGLVGLGTHECDCVTMHEARNAGPHAAPVGPDRACSGDETAAGCDADCPNGHGQAQPGLLGVPPSTQACPGRWHVGDPASAFRSHAPPQPLRPPQAKLA